MKKSVINTTALRRVTVASIFILILIVLTANLGWGSLADLMANYTGIIIFGLLVELMVTKIPKTNLKTRKLPTRT